MKRLLFFAVIATSLFACHSNKGGDDEDSDNVRSRTPVSVTTITRGPMSETVHLNAVSSYLVKSPVFSNTNGYVLVVDKQLNTFVSKGEPLFTIRTREAHSLQNNAALPDSVLKFKGDITITAPESGYISQLNIVPGDYVQDGQQLATINVEGSFVFLLNLPYEYRSFLPKDKKINLLLPDSTVLNGTISNELPSVDPVSQTQNIAIHVNASHPIPENLIAVVSLVTKSKPDAVSLPKPALLTDDAQSSFWVMKLINDSTAVKTPVTKGIENENQVEILSPAFSSTDRIVTIGNYGLPDTALVKITTR